MPDTGSQPHASLSLSTVTTTAFKNGASKVVRSIKLPALHAKSALVQSTTSMRNYMTKTILRPTNGWRIKNSHDPVDDTGSTSETMTDEGDKSSAVLVVVAILSVDVMMNSPATPIPKELKYMTCRVHYGGSVKQTKGVILSSAASPREVNEKFVYQAAEHSYDDVRVEIMARRPTLFRSSGLSSVAELAIPLNDIFRSTSIPSPVQKVEEMSCSSYNCKIIVSFLVHRIPIASHASRQALESLAKSPVSVDDQEDMSKYGSIFPDIWYLIPDTPFDD